MTLKQKLAVETIEEIQCFRFFREGGRIDRLDFIPSANTPGFSHRVAFNGKLTPKYLGEDFAKPRIAKKTALDMLDLVLQWEATQHADWCLLNHPECGPLHCTCGFSKIF